MKVSMQSLVSMTKRIIQIDDKKPHIDMLRDQNNMHTQYICHVDSLIGKWVAIMVPNIKQAFAFSIFSMRIVFICRGLFLLFM